MTLHSLPFHQARDLFVQLRGNHTAAHLAANAILLLLDHLAARGETLPAGSFVMTGGITEAIPVAAGDNITARFQNMGSISFRFV